MGRKPLGMRDSLGWSAFLCYLVIIACFLMRQGAAPFKLQWNAVKGLPKYFVVYTKGQSARRYKSGEL